MTYEQQMEEALAGFFTEAAELLGELEAGLLDLEDSGGDSETVNAVFRAVHTIKGSAGLFGLRELVRFTHVVESVLDRVRAEELALSRALVDVLLPCKDQMTSLVESASRGAGEAEAELVMASDSLIGHLEPFLHVSSHGDASSRGGAAPVVATDVPVVDEAMVVSVRFGRDCLRSGMDPIPFIRFLGSEGTVIEVLTVDELLPEPHEMDPESVYLSFVVGLRTASSVEQVLDVFEFVRDESDIRVIHDGSTPDERAALVSSYGAAGERVERFLARMGLVQPAGDPGELVADVARGPVGDSNADRKAAEAKTIRVDAARLDRLIDTVGEMVIAGAGAGLHASNSGSETLKASIAEVMRLIEGVRDDALRLRMVPIGTTFGRFQRVVRDVSAALGKDVGLTITGGETEVDKALVEQIGDPLMHLVRNALDHGIESPETRRARGKSARGELILRAFHDSGSIVVEVQDDGGGIDPEVVRAKAVQRGLIDPSASLSDKEAFSLIFEPGFSTAAQVSDLSGRGVGMDVVKRNVMALRGTIDVDSRPGAGTTVRIRLPLTLAIIDGFMVGVGATTFVIPLDRVVECVERPPSAVAHDYMDLRGNVLPLIRLRSVMSIGGDPPRRENVVVVEHAGVTAGLVVDILQGEFQTVIKPLGPMFADAHGIGGSTILGNGEVALIIDVPMLVKTASSRGAMAKA